MAADPPSPPEKQSPVTACNFQNLYKTKLIPLSCSFGVVTEKTEESSALSKVVTAHVGNATADVTILFAVRQPGCISCRGHAAMLSDLAAKDGKIALVGVTKQTGADDDGLLEYYERFFHHPIYKDPQWQIYRAMGGRKVSLWQVFKFAMKDVRLWKKGAKAMLSKDDFWTEGGTLIFDRKGMRFAMR
jgi:hypothetical protein